jgi:hypothetical protein
VKTCQGGQASAPAAKRHVKPKSRRTVSVEGLRRCCREACNAQDARISASPKVLELEAFTERIRQEIENQLPYRYARLF